MFKFKKTPEKKTRIVGDKKSVLTVKLRNNFWANADRTITLEKGFDTESVYKPCSFNRRSGDYYHTVRYTTWTLSFGGSSMTWKGSNLSLAKRRANNLNGVGNLFALLVGKNV